jgi:hypothetical protein
VEVERLAEGLWRWTTGGHSSVYLETTEAIALFDPVVSDEPEQRERFLRALDRDVERLGLPVAILHTGAARVGELPGRYPAFARLPPGVEAFPAGRNARVYWIPAHRAIVAGDALAAPGAPLRPLLDLPIETVLPAHGEPIVAGARESLAAALA